MPGLSASSRRVRYLNANWTMPPDGVGDGTFEFLVVTEDGQRHVVPVSAAAATAIVAMTQSPDVVLIWDPEAGGLTVGNLLGRMLKQDLSLLPE